MPLPIHPSMQRPRQVIAIAAGKGGVGKSTITVNLARALQSEGYAVGILDADLYGPSLRRMLPESRLPSQHNGRFLPAESDGIRLLSMAYFRKENEATAVRAPIANSLIQQFLTQVDWGSLDFLLIDFPPGTGDIQLTLCQRAQLTGAVMVTTPQEVALMDVRKAMDLFSQVRVPILGVVENMSYFLNSENGQAYYLFGKGGGDRLAGEAGVPMLGHVPIVPSISRSGDEGESLFKMQDADAQIACKAFRALATNVTKALQGSVDALGIAKIDFDAKQRLSIQWTDGVVSEISCATLQQHCPCAACVDEVTGQRRGSCQTPNEELAAQSIDLVGRYALKVYFSSGCSAGIYPFSLIRSLSGISSSR